ncbi:MAG: phosphoglycerate kinase [Alphaproteobacteria bacterium]
MTDFATLDDLDCRGKRVLLRVDLNVPMQDGKVTDSTRIDRVAPTIRALRDRGARVVLLAHFGRPKGKPVADMSLAPVAAAVGAALGGIAVAFADDCVGAVAAKAVATLGDGDVLLLENLRFHAGEEANDPAFARALAELGDVYVNDAFSAAHRAHASTEGLAHLLPSAAGLAMAAELKALDAALEHPEHPVMAIVGGAKVSTKIDLLSNLSAKVQVLVIGGGMANTFLHARGFDVGASLHEADLVDTARNIMVDARNNDCEIVLPVDAVVARALKPGEETRIVKISKVPHSKMILDVGPHSAETIIHTMRTCRTLLWNGPLGAFETPPFDAATNAVAREAADRTRKHGLVSVAGGGDTVAALAHAGVVGDFTYVSTAGGAFLEWLEGRELPGVAALKAAKARR